MKAPDAGGPGTSTDTAGSKPLSLLRFMLWASAAALLFLLVMSAPLLAIWSPHVFGALLPLHMMATSLMAAVGLVVFGGPLWWAHRFERAEARRAQAGEDQAAWAPVPPPGGPRAAVVLIHGTFARSNEWTQPQAALPQALAGRATVAIFSWTDANSMRSRRIAAERLRRYVGALAAAGFGPITLIGHSHAGNIALKACEDADTARRVRCIVCMATPFIAAWRPTLRVVRRGFARLGLFMVAGVAGLAMVYLPQVLVGSLADLQAPRVVAAFVSCGVLALTVALGCLFMAARFHLGDAEAALDPDIEGSVCTEAGVAPLRDRTLILSRGGDEADGVLKLASLLNRQLVAMANVQDSRRGQAYTRGVHVIDDLRLSGLFISAAQGLVALLASVSSLAFGANGLRHQTGIYFTSAETPPGQWTHVNLGNTPDGSGLSHSSLYSDPRAIEHILRWLVLQGACLTPPAAAAPDRPA